MKHKKKKEFNNNTLLIIFLLRRAETTTNKPKVKINDNYRTQAYIINYLWHGYNIIVY